MGRLWKSIFSTRWTYTHRQASPPSMAATGTYHVSGNILKSPSDSTNLQTLPTFATFTIN